MARSKLIKDFISSNMDIDIALQNLMAILYCLDNDILITNIRHKNIISKSLENVKKSKEALEMNLPIDIITIYIKNILEDLGEITGEVVTEDIINEIFSKFCLGK